MEAVGHLKTVRVALMHNRPEKRIGVSLHAPCVVKVILGSGTVQARILLPVDEEHIVSFAPPASLVVLHRQVAAHIMSSSLHIQHRIISLALEVGHVVDLRGVCLDIRSPSVAGILPSPACVEIGRVLIQRLLVHFVINIEIQNKRQLVLVHNLDLRLFVEGHREITGHGAGCAVASGFLRLQRNIKRQGAEIARIAVSDAEEISKGHQHTWRILIVPCNLNQCLSIIKRIVIVPDHAQRRMDFHHGSRRCVEHRVQNTRCLHLPAGRGHPDMGNTPRSLHFTQHNTLLRRNLPVVLIFTALIPAGQPSVSRLFYSCQILK